MATTDMQPTVGPQRASRPEAGLRRTLTVLRRRAWVVILCVVVAGAAAYGISKTQTKKYTATSSLLFNNESAAQQVAGVTGTAVNDPAGQRATNLLLVQLANVSVSRIAAAALPLVSPSQIRSAVTATQAGQSNIVSISATTTDPNLSALIANAYTRAFTSQQRQSDQATVQNGISLVQQQYDALTKVQQAEPQGQGLLDRIESLKVVKSVQSNTQVVQRAQAPTAPSSPRVARNVTLGIVLGLLLGLVLAFQRDNFDQRLRNPAEVEGSFAIPMLGVIPHGSGRPTDHHLDGWAVELEPFRMLRAHLRYFNIDRDVRTVLVVSPFSAEGKTTVAHGLAAAAASVGGSTLLIEADLRAPVMKETLNLAPGVGLTGALISSNRISEAIQHVDIEGQTNGNTPGRVLDVLPAGAVPPNPAEMLESDAMDYLLRWARERYDFVVIDSAPLSLVPDSIPLLNRVDGVIVVSRLGRSTRDAAENLRERLISLDAPLLGVVVNDMRSRSGSYGYGDYGGDQRSAGETTSSVRAAD